jgi:hypothetical protein
LALFGLGGNASIDSIVVRWPMMGCAKTTVPNPGTNEVHTINANGLVVAQAAPKEGGIHVWPNPTSGQFHLRAEHLERSGLKVLVFDQFGREIQTISQQESPTGWYLDLAGQAAGMYVVMLVDEHGQHLEHRRVVLQ